MPIVGASIMPHFPVLLSTIGGSKTELLTSTLTAIANLSDAIQQRNPEVLVIIAPHNVSPLYQGLVSEQLTTDLKAFGDITHQKTFYGNYLPLFQLKKRVPKDLALISHATISYEISVPLLLITERQPKFSEISAIHTSSTRSPIEHMAFGSELREVLETSNKRYMIIASCDFGRYTAPIAEAQNVAAACDKLILQSLRSNNFEHLLHPTEHADYLNTWVCGIKPLSMLIGVLGGSNYTTSILSYDHTLDLGLLVANLELA